MVLATHLFVAVVIVWFIRLEVRMSKAFESVQKVFAILDKIEADVIRIKAQLPAEGGMTPAEVAELQTALDGLAVRAQSIDDATPEPVVEPAVESAASVDTIVWGS